MNTHNLLDKAFAFTEEKRLFSAPCRVVVGVSGGADSMALLHCLSHWPSEGLSVVAVHIHHGLRGRNADRDADFVYRYCDQHHIPFVLCRVDAAAYAAQHHCSVEDAGRRLRYARFEEVRREWDADCVLTAHTADDQAETVLMRIIRGSGVDGLSGIPAARDAIRRPLLDCTRKEVEDYCAQNGVPYVVDETNTDTAFTRNRIRHELLPLLRRINPSTAKALMRLSRHAAEDSFYLRSVACDALRAAQREGYWDAAILRQQPVPVRRRIWSLMMTEASVSSYDEKHILAAEQVLDSGCGSVHLPNDTRLTVRQGRVYIEKRSSACASVSSVCLTSLPWVGTFGSISFSLNLHTAENVHNLLANTAIDYDKIQGGLYIRCRQEGDYIHPAGRTVGKSLKKAMNEWRIPAHLRDAYPVLCDESGIVLVPGYGCDERVRPATDTKHFLVWHTATEQG